MPNFVFFTPPLLKGVWRYTLITHHMGLTQIDLIIQILLFPLRFPRFLRETTNPLADCADAAERYMGLTQIDLIKQIYYFLLRFLRFLRDTPHHSSDSADNLYNPINLCEPITSRRAYCNNALITHDMGLTQIDLIKQIYYFLLRFPRFLRETTNPLADGADAAERYMGLSQIDLIKQILLFPLRVPRFLRETPLPPHTAQKILEIQLICVSQSPESAVSAISARYSSSSRRWRRCRRKVYGSHSD